MLKRKVVQLHLPMRGKRYKKHPRKSKLKKPEDRGGNKAPGTRSSSRKIDPSAKSKRTSS